MDDSALLDGIWVTMTSRTMMKNKPLIYSKRAANEVLMSRVLIQNYHLPVCLMWNRSAHRPTPFISQSIQAQKIIKSKSKENHPTTVDLLSELNKMNTTMVALADKKLRQQKKSNMEKK